jgi:NAD(P)-dependent dehydrogenase (short-subunit alcohol dehydrogenase family)
MTLKIETAKSATPRPVVLTTGALTGIGRVMALAVAHQGTPFLFLASDEAPSITGQSLTVDGGKTAA